MITVTDITLNPKKKTAKVTLFADSMSDVTSSMTVDGVPSGYTFDTASIVYTADADVAFYKSDGTWNWI